MCMKSIPGLPAAGIRPGFADGAPVRKAHDMKSGATCPQFRVDGVGFGEVTSDTGI